MGLIYIKLTGLLYVWIKPCFSSGSYRWRIHARSSFLLMAILYLSQNKVALGQDLPKQFGYSAGNIRSIFIPISSGWGKMGPLKVTFTQRHVSLQRRNREILNYRVIPRVISAISYILFLWRQLFS